MAARKTKTTEVEDRAERAQQVTTQSGDAQEGEQTCPCAYENVESVIEQAASRVAVQGEVACEQVGLEISEDSSDFLSDSEDDSAVQADEWLDDVGDGDAGEAFGTEECESAVGRWCEGGRSTFSCGPEDDDEYDEDGNLGRFDIHDPHQLGQLGEHIAARYLRMYDYKILERNYRCEHGEADIICTRDDSVVLVEVKTRLGSQALPEEAVTVNKLRRYRRITLDYLVSHEWFENVRLDVIAVNIVEDHLAQVHHFMGVCTWEG